MIGAVPVALTLKFAAEPGHTTRLVGELLINATVLTTSVALLVAAPPQPPVTSTRRGCSIAFGNGAMAGPKDTLFFAAGPHRWRGSTEVGVHGLLGSISR